MTKKDFGKNGVRIVYITTIGATFGQRIKHCLKVLLGLDMKITSDISPEDLIAIEEKNKLIKKN